MWEKEKSPENEMEKSRQAAPELIFNMYEVIV